MTRARIRDVAEGNPLFVEQLVALLAEDGQLDDVPPTIHALLAARLDGLSEAERDLLERASVIGHDFEWEALGKLAADRKRPSGTMLAALVRKELIRPHELVVDTFRFRHVLIRDAAYERLPKALRAELHERFAGWLDGRGDEFDEIVGYHLEQAFHSLSDLGPPDERAGGLADRAAERLSTAGFRAAGRGDTHGAANLLERAAALLASNDPRRLTVLTVLGPVLEEAGRLDDCDRVLSEAIELARASGDEAVALDVGVSLQALRLHTAEASIGQRAVREAVERAIAFFTTAGDDARLARALATAGKLRFWRGEAGPAIGDLEAAARHARRAGVRAHEIESLQYVLIAMLSGPTPVPEALARSDELERETEPSRLLRVHLLRVRAHLHAMEGRFELARDLISEAKALAEELGLEVTLARMAIQAGQIELLAGDPVAAERELRPASDRLERMGDWGHLAGSLAAPR